MLNLSESECLSDAEMDDAIRGGVASALGSESPSTKAEKTNSQMKGQPQDQRRFSSAVLILLPGTFCTNSSYNNFLPKSLSGGIEIKCR